MSSKSASTSKSYVPTTESDACSMSINSPYLMFIALWKLFFQNENLIYRLFRKPHWYSQWCSQQTTSLLHKARFQTLCTYLVRKCLLYELEWVEYLPISLAFPTSLGPHFPNLFIHILLCILSIKFDHIGLCVHFDIILVFSIYSAIFFLPRPTHAFFFLIPLF